MVLVLLTFGAGSKRYYDALFRLVQQSKDFNFDKVISYTDLDLQNLFPDFWKKHVSFIEKNKRGYGYWIWKPYIILETLKTLNKDDILLYLDCGCELNSEGKQRFNEYIDLVKINDRMLFHIEDQHLEWRWSKMDLIKHLNMENNANMMLPQAESGMQFYKCCDSNIKLLSEYYNTCCLYNLIDDSTSKHKNSVYFIENRHDQSVLSLLFKKYNYFTIFDETWPSTMKGDKKQYPIWALRNYSSISKIKF